MEDNKVFIDSGKIIREEFITNASIELGYIFYSLFSPVKGDGMRNNKGLFKIVLTWLGLKVGKFRDAVRER